MTKFLFVNAAVSGIRILERLGLTRRDRFIVSAALAIGVGVSLVPNWFEYIFAHEGDSAGIQAVFDAVKITVSTSYCIGAIIAIVLNPLLPFEEEDLVAWSAEAAAPLKSLDDDKEVTDAALMDGASSGSS